jgi:hypothetical protein
MKTYQGHITSLKPNQVFVYGGNLQGFHGAGAAGFASFGVPGNVWRKFNYDQWPNGKQGKWNIKGVAEGLQQGTEGKSYAIPTVTRPGARRSIPLEKIRVSIARLYAFARLQPDLEFLVAYTASGSNLNGYTPDEMAEAFALCPIPHNLVFEENFAKLIERASHVSNPSFT